MNTIKSYYSCAELAEMKLPGLPSSERGMRHRIKKENWESRQVKGKGGKDGIRTEYHPPAKIRGLIGMAQLKQLRPELSESMLKELRGISRHINNLIKIMGGDDE